jgi:hypothetical protein
VALGPPRVPRPHAPGKAPGRSESLDGGERRGCVVHSVLGQGQAPVVRERRSPGGARHPVVFGPAARLPIQRHHRRRRLRAWGEARDDLVSPRAQVRRALVPIHLPHDGVQRGRAGGRAGAAQRRRDPRAIMASPGGEGTLAARATHHRTTRQAAYRRARGAVATRLTKVGDRSTHGNARTGMGYHQAPPLGRGVAHVGEAGHAKPPSNTTLSLFLEPIMQPLDEN